MRLMLRRATPHMKASQMGLSERSVTRDELLSDEQASRTPAGGARSGFDDPLDDSDPLRAAKGTVLGVILSGTLWAVILWAIL